MNLISVYPANDRIDIACYQGKEKVGTTSVPYPECSCEIGSVVETVKNVFSVDNFDVGVTCYSMAPQTFDGFLPLTPDVVDGICQAKYGFDKTNYGTIILASIGAKKMVSAYPLTYDCFSDVMRFSGIPQIERRMVGRYLDHSLAYGFAQKSCGRNKPVVTCYLSNDEITMAAWRDGKLLNMNSSWDGEGPMTMTRSGFFHQKCVYRLCFSGKKTREEMIARVRFNGGVFSHLGIADLKELEEVVAKGDAKAKVIYDAMVYQISKTIGRMAVMCQRPEMIVFTGTLSTDAKFVGDIKSYIDYICKTETAPAFDGTNELAGLVWSHE